MAASTARSLLKFTSPASSLLRYGDAFTRTKRRSKKGKKVKDRFAPKRGATAYAYYCTEMRQSVKGEDSTGKNKKAVTKVLGERWKLLNGEDKDKYLKMAEKDKLRYEEEIKSYTPRATSEEQQGGQQAGPTATGWVYTAATL